jgi:hypothetical protein
VKTRLNRQTPGNRANAREADSREICYDGLARAPADVDIVLDPQWYWPYEAIASPDMLVLWEREFGQLPEPIDEIIVRCRTYVMAAAPRLVVIEPYARIARAARVRGQRLAGVSRLGDRPVCQPLLCLTSRP